MLPNPESKLWEEMMAKLSFLATNFSFLPEVGVFRGTIWITFALSHGNEKTFLTMKFWVQCNVCRPPVHTGEEGVFWRWDSLPENWVMMQFWPLWDIFLQGHEHPSHTTGCPGGLFSSWVNICVDQLSQMGRWNARGRGVYDDRLF